MDQRAKKEDIYGNHEVYSPAIEGHPDGVLMFRNKLKRIDWYLDRNLASLIEHKAGVKKIQLHDMPNGLGRYGDPYLDQVMHNRCVISGNTDSLNRHHIVPRMYRTLYPLYYKKMCHHDVVAIDVKLHSHYENTSANELKSRLAKEYDAPLNPRDCGIGYLMSVHIHSVIEYGHFMPQEKKDRIFNDVKKYLNKSVLTQSDIDYVHGLKSKYDEEIRNHGKVVLERFDDMQGFVEMWREHFLEYTKPQFMPDNWDIKRPINMIEYLNNEL